MELFNSSLFSLFSDSQRSQLLAQGRWGLEREALRVTPAGELALTPHPAVFGDKQRNSRITTDFSESQLEMITTPRRSIREVYRELEDIHREIYGGLGDEFLWPLSMPGRLPDEQRIPIARYGTETEQEIYRKGLALRYGKKMQMISGIHYNYSFSLELLRFLYAHSHEEKINIQQSYPDFVDALYFSVARNVLRYRWLLLYLFGASPAFDETYEHEMLGKIDAEEFHDATSFRMSRLGYYNPRQENVSVSYNSKAEYVRDVRTLLNTRSEQYAALGLHKDGKRRQLNDRILQQASEFYAPIRFKQPLLNGENPLHALETQGVAYLEMRVLDLDPFSPSGVDLNALYFSHTLMVYSLLAESPALDRHEMEECKQNHHRVALHGRKTGLSLSRKGRPIGLRPWARELLRDLLHVAALLDSSGRSTEYTQSMHLQLQKLDNPELLPSATIANEMQSAGHDMTSYGLARIRSLHEALNDVEQKDAELSIDIPALGRLPFLAGRFAENTPAVTKLPAQCC